MWDNCKGSKEQITLCLANHIEDAAKGRDDLLNLGTWFTQNKMLPIQFAGSNLVLIENQRLAYDPSRGGAGGTQGDALARISGGTPATPGPGGQPRTRYQDILFRLQQSDCIKDGATAVDCNKADIGDALGLAGDAIGFAAVAKIGKGGADLPVTAPKPKFPEDGGTSGGPSESSRMVDYSPDKTVLRQGDTNTCGPTCCCMLINDSGKSVDLSKVISDFSEIRSGGVNIIEMSDVLKKNGIASTYEMGFTPAMLDSYLSSGKPAIVQVTAGNGFHFIIIDKVSSINNINYYMTRDPYTGPRGTRSDILHTFMTGEVVILKK